MYFVKQFRHYLKDQKLKIRTDHKALAWLRNFKEPDDQIARWQLYLGELDMVIFHRKGSDHGNTNDMWRWPSKQPQVREHDDGLNSDNKFCQAVSVSTELN